MIFIYSKEFSEPYHQTLIGIYPTAKDFIACKESCETRCHQLGGYLHEEHHNLEPRPEPGKNKNLSFDDSLSQDLHFAIQDLHKLTEGQTDSVNIDWIIKTIESADRKYNITGSYVSEHKEKEKPTIESTDYRYDFNETLEELENFISKYKRGLR